MAIERKNDAFSGLDSALDAEMIKIPKAGLPQLKGFKEARQALNFTRNLHNYQSNIFTNFSRTTSLRGPA